MLVEGRDILTMKILMVSEDIPHASMGGLGRHAMTLARALERAGHTVDVLGNANAPFEPIQKEFGFAGRFFERIRGHRIGWKEQRMGVFNPLKRPVIARRIARPILALALGYDVVHYHGHSPTVANLIPLSVNFVQTRHDQGSDCLVHVRFRNHGVCTETEPRACAACITPHPNRLQQYVSALAVTRYRDAVARAFRRHKTIFVSEMLRRNFCRTAGDGSWGAVIHNFVDYARVREYAQGPSVHNDMVQILIAGKLWGPKGVDAFLTEAAPRLPPTMHVRVAGDGEAELRARFGSERIEFLGWRSYADTMRLLAEADIVVVPSICEESCATTVLEALALGKTTLALRRGGTPELTTYQRYAGQLRLYDSLDALVSALATTSDTALPCDDGDFEGDVMQRLADILSVYTSDRQSSSS